MEVAQRDVEHGLAGPQGVFGADVRVQGGGGEDDEVGGEGFVEAAGADGVAGRAVAFGEVAGERRCGVRVEVVADHVGQFDAGGGQVPADGTGDHTGADHADAGGRAVAECGGRQGGGRGGARGADAGRFQEGEGVAGAVVVEDEDGGGAGQPFAGVRGEAADPFDAGYGVGRVRVRGLSCPVCRVCRGGFRAAEEGRQGDDPRVGLVGEAQEVAVRVDGASRVVGQIGVLDPGDDLALPSVEEFDDVLAGQYGEFGHVRRGSGGSVVSVSVPCVSVPCV